MQLLQTIHAHAFEVENGCHLIVKFYVDTKGEYNFLCYYCYRPIGNKRTNNFFEIGDEFPKVVVCGNCAYSYSKSFSGK